MRRQIQGWLTLLFGVDSRELSRYNLYVKFLGVVVVMMISMAEISSMKVLGFLSAKILGSLAL